jgi:hypothetical protein
MNTDELLAPLYEYFPDGTEVMMMPFELVMESVLKDDITKWPAQPVEYEETIIHLTELFPDAGIFAAMSPLTHCVYCFIPGEI